MAPVPAVGCWLWLDCHPILTIGNWQLPRQHYQQPQLLHTYDNGNLLKHKMCSDLIWQKSNEWATGRRGISASEKGGGNKWNWCVEYKIMRVYVCNRVHKTLPPRFAKCKSIRIMTSSELFRLCWCTHLFSWFSYSTFLWIAYSLSC